MIFDYWKDPRGEYAGLPALLSEIPAGKPLYVFVSHHHKDHLNTDIFNWWKIRENVHYILSKDVAKFCRHYLKVDSKWKGEKVPQDIVTIVQPGNRYCIGPITVDTFGSTDIGCSFVVNVSGKLFFHAGDLNAWIWKDESTLREVETAISQYQSIVDSIATEHPAIDYAMFPVDSRIGTDYFTGAKIFVTDIDVRKFFPMHFELADDPVSLEKRHRDASAFGLYANTGRGEYIFLSSPGDTYMSMND